MMSYIYYLIVIFLSLASTLSAHAESAVHAPQQLRVEYETQPMCVDVIRPRFSWTMETDSMRRGQQQKAYRIVVTDERGHTVWDSGRVADSRSLHVLYGGERLTPETRYTWEVSVWDERDRIGTGRSWFETGLMDSSIRAWRGAKWIGVPDTGRVLYSHYLSVFRISFSIQLDQKSRSSRAAFIYGANDERLIHSYMNPYGMSNGRDSSYIMVEMDTQPLDRGQEAVLHVYRRGYCPTDTCGKPVGTFVVPLSILSATNRYAPHRIAISCNFGSTYIYMDGNEKPIGHVDMNPVGQGGDFVAFPVVGDLGFKVDAGQKASLSNVEVKHWRSPSATIARISSLDLTCKSGFCRIIDPSCHAMPMLRHAFTAARAIVKARLYVTSRGVYDMTVNGCRVADDYLNPGFTQYDKTQRYQCFDVTRLLRKGDNVMGATLGEGWWSGNMTYQGDCWNYFGDRLSLLAQLVVTYDDGSRQVEVTSPSAWTCYTDGPIRYGSLFQGEVYDARKAESVGRWSMSGYDDSQWEKAVEIGTEGHVSRVGWGNGPAVDRYDDLHIVGQQGPVVRPVMRLHAVAVTHPRPGVYVYDMGQNMVGVPVIRFPSLRPGTCVTMRYAEMLYPHSPSYSPQEGMVMVENIRAAMARDIYTACGETDSFSPRFTYHGYRYLEVSGIDEALPLDSVEGLVLSSLHDVRAHYETSNPDVDRLWQNIVWSARSNFFSVPTDCPQRNERLGWAGDISVFSRTATYLTDGAQFLRSYLRSMRDVQHADGRMPDIAPLGGGFGGLLWGSASITVPWESYQQYADTAMLSEHYEAMQRYIQYVESHYIDLRTQLLVQEHQWGDLGDWLGLEESKNDKSLLWECYYIYDLDIMSQVSRVLGHDREAARYAQRRDERKAFFRRTYLDADGCTIASAFRPDIQGKPVDVQTSYVLPIVFNVVDDSLRDRVEQHLITTVERQNRMDDGRVAPPYSLLTGFIGTAWIAPALSEAGAPSTAYRLLQNKAFPSWLYPVTQGATTIWERLNSYTHDNGFGGNNRMNSFNHYSFGAIGSWLMDRSLGIARDSQQPGFHHFVLRPQPDPTRMMTYARGYYESMYGRIESSWQITGEGTVYTFLIPANTTATLLLPMTEGEHVYEKGKSAKKRRYRGGQRCAGHMQLQLKSGRYCFVVRP